MIVDVISVDLMIFGIDEMCVKFVVEYMYSEDEVCFIVYG